MAGMKNAVLIALEEAQLIRDGKMDESEQLHTFAGWKERGYSVRKGEKAIAKFPIWKQTFRKNKETGEQEKDRMIMKMSCWFKTSQVDKIAAI